MDRAISSSEANQHFSEMLRDVQGGETFVVTSHGRPVAKIVPIVADAQRRSVDALLGFLQDLPRRRAGSWTRDSLYD